MVCIQSFRKKNEVQLLPVMTQAVLYRGSNVVRRNKSSANNLVLPFDSLNVVATTPIIKLYLCLKELGLIFQH